MQFACTRCGLTMAADAFRHRKNGHREKRCRSCERAYMRQRYADDPDLIRERKRVSMAKARAADIEGARSYARSYHARIKDRRNAALREMNATRIFWARAQKLKGVSPRDLFRLWKAQRGLCALTGRKLGRDAQVDHILPKAHGGGDEITNIQWVCADANLAKRNLTDAEFHALCADVIRWIGERIARVDALPLVEARAA
jgi:5-methylcytosine-specific restriction endonuclease McrA